MWLLNYCFSWIFNKQRSYVNSHFRWNWELHVTKSFWNLKFDWFSPFLNFKKNCLFFNENLLTFLRFQSRARGKCCRNALMGRTCLVVSFLLEMWGRKTMSLIVLEQVSFCTRGYVVILWPLLYWLNDMTWSEYYFNINIYSIIFLLVILQL